MNIALNTRNSFPNRNPRSTGTASTNMGESSQALTANRYKEMVARHNAMKEMQESMLEVLLASNKIRSGFADYLLGGRSSSEGEHRSLFY